MSHPRYVLQRPRPLIAARIEFRPAPRPPRPLIAARIEFTLERLNRHRIPAGTEASTAPTTTEPPRQAVPPPAGPSTIQPPPPPHRQGSPSSRSKIPKPNGEPGRPGSGGFNLEATLADTHGWTVAEVENFMKFLRKEARRSLDKTVSYRAQRKSELEKLCERASEQSDFPDLTDYEDCWPVKSALKLICKYQSEISRRKETRSTTARVRDAISGKNGNRRGQDDEDDEDSSSDKE